MNFLSRLEEVAKEIDRKYHGTIIISIKPCHLGIEINARDINKSIVKFLSWQDVLDNQSEQICLQIQQLADGLANKSN